ncbi:hypothetical protein pb186bvf_016753 [Paramecium bursaria]
MSFQDIDINEHVIIASQDLLNESFSQEQVERDDVQPQFSQSQNSHILSEIANTPQQPRMMARKSLIPQVTGGLFSYLIDNQAKIYDVFQNFLHRLFQYLYTKQKVENNFIKSYLDLQNIKRKLTYIQTVYNQTFQALKNCITSYQEKVIIMTSDQDKEDPYSLLTQCEIDLRRALHEFYQFIDNDDPFSSSKGMQGMLGSQNLSHIRSNPTLDVLNPQELDSVEKMANFVLHSIELEQLIITPKDLLDDPVSANLLSVSNQLIQIWNHFFRFLSQYDRTNIQFNFEIEAQDLNAAQVAIQSLLYIPLDIQNKISRGNYKELQNYSLNTSGKLPLNSHYNDSIQKKKQAKLQQFVSFDKLDNILKIADDALTNENDNFSFSNADHSMNEDLSDYQQTIQKYRINYNAEQYKQTIMVQAYELGFKGKINESHLQDLQPPKHRSYVAEVGQMFKRVTPFILKKIEAEKKSIEIQNLDYFSQMAFLHLFKPFTKTLFFHELESENVKKIQVDVEQEFTPQLVSFASQEGYIFVFNPFSEGADNKFYKFDLERQILQKLPTMLEMRKDFRVVQQGHYIYVIGGIDQKGEVLKTCERFSMKKIEWQKVRGLQIPLSKPNVVIFQNRYIMRFGGINKFGHYDKTIERYDTKRHKWYNCRIESEPDLQFNIDALNVQTNMNDILSISGVNYNGFYDPKILHLTFEEDQKRENVKAYLYG